jgi:hypothetical protein
MALRTCTSDDKGGLIKEDTSYDHNGRPQASIKSD